MGERKKMCYTCSRIYLVGGSGNKERKQQELDSAYQLPADYFSDSIISQESSFSILESYSDV